MRSFDGKTILITGAGSGIGRASAIRLASEGANIVGLDLSDTALEETGGLVSAQGGNWRAVAGNIADLSKLDLAFSVALNEFRGLDGLVNNAAVRGPTATMDEIGPSDFDEVVAINLKAVWYALKLARAPMRSRGGGAIVNIASMAAMRPNPRLPLYGMTKAGVVSLTLQAALDYAKDGVRVNCVCPGPVKTSMSQGFVSHLPLQEANEIHRRIARTTALNRYGEPEELAAAIRFLLSADASFITGAIMPVDGGSSAK